MVIQGPAGWRLPGWGYFFCWKGGGVSRCPLTFLSVGDAAVTLAEHAAESADALGVPPAVEALPSQGDAEAKVPIAGETPSTGPVVVARGLGRKRQGGC